MFNKIWSKKSVLISTNNGFLRHIQNTEIAGKIRQSLFFHNIDTILYVLLLLTLLFCAFLTSDVIGLFALSFAVLSAFKLFVKKGARVKISLFDKAILCYFIFVVLSLFASTNFVLSFKGFIKTATYIYFYMSISNYFQDNKKKILPTILVIGLFVAFESVVAIIQNHTGILAISGWQDTTNLDPTQVISRAYGTLQPYNPNLLAGYLVCAMPCLWCLGAYNFVQKNYKRFLTCLLFLICAIVAVIYSGSRGGYLGVGALFVLSAISIIWWVQKYSGGFRKMKKRYKNLMAGLVAAFLAFVLTNPAITKRIISIFEFREDSSIAFRLNVYASSFKMFLDNPFLGIGVGNKNFREIYGLYMRTGFDALGSYCVPLEIAVESGIFALVSFVIFLWLWLKNALKVIKNSDIKTQIIAFSLVMSVICTMVHGFFDTIWFRPQVQILFWLNVAILNALNVEEKAEN